MKEILDQTSSDAVKDRSRRIAFAVSLIGLAANCVIASAYGLTSGFTTILAFNFLLQTVAIGSICASSHLDWHFKTVLNAAIAIIYVHLWSTTLYEAWIGAAFPLSFVVLLFVPFCLVIVSGHRVLLAYALMQGALVYIYTSMFMAQAFGLNPDAVEFTQLAAALSIMSALTLLVLAFVSYSRLKLDTRLLQLVHETRRLAEEDALTGLTNRRAFMDRLNAAWRSKEDFLVAFIDLDRFKPLNDEYGHAAGDQVLRAIADRLSSYAYTKTSSRFGGDEFAVLLRVPEHGDDLSKTLEELHASIVGDIQLAEFTVTVGASIGYARSVQDGASIGELLHAADTAMRRAKTNGGGAARFNPSLDSVALSSAAMEELFRKALARGDIRPALQPIVDAKSKKVIGHELLSRWVRSGLPRDPSPNEFIPIAEKLGLLNDLLWQSLDLAIPKVKQGNGFLAVNVSPSQLSSHRFLSGLQKIGIKHKFDLSRLEIEITETVAFRNLEKNIQVLESARLLGCRIALDDFGAGYSSLSLLEDLPLDKVKLDKSLQATLNKRGVLKATVQLAKSLGFICCVEGIETDRAAQFAMNLECDQMQGYLFGAPVLVPEADQRRSTLKSA
ncbi:MAG TPA: EAL domain-containing protein [Hyphomonas sp.]|nr:EAL domain-containing protein [Hyphomonas sp.]HRX73012.1 EAL domain-containing protein [Hyphomonas sp.]